jgi:hypothetical protein
MGIASHCGAWPFRLDQLTDREIIGTAQVFSMRVLAGHRTTVDESRACRIKRSETSRPALNVVEQ